MTSGFKGYARVQWYELLSTKAEWLSWCPTVWFLVSGSGTKLATMRGWLDIERWELFAFPNANVHKVVDYLSHWLVLLGLGWVGSIAQSVEKVKSHISGIPGFSLVSLGYSSEPLGA